MKKVVYLLAALGVIVAITRPVIAATYVQKRARDLLMDNRSCLFFQLDGVIEADPVMPGNPWFALPKSAPNFQEMHSWILSARLSNTPLNVTTDGTVSCGTATVIGVGVP